MNGKYYYYAPTYHAYDNVKGHAKMQEKGRAVLDKTSHKFLEKRNRYNRVIMA